MKVWLIVMLLLDFSAIAYASEENPAQQFDFLIGEHEVTLHAWTGETWTPPRPVNAKWNGWRGLEDQAIYDEWIDPESGRGVNVRLYDEKESIWKMMWISTSSYQVQDLRAEMRNGVLTMWQIYPERPGWFAEFKQLDKCRWARVGYQSGEDAVPKPRFRLVAKRKGCS